MDNLTASVEGRPGQPARLGDLMIGWIGGWAYWTVTSVTPILSKGSAGGGRAAEVKVEGYCLGLKRSSPPI